LARFKPSTPKGPAGDTLCSFPEVPSCDQYPWLLMQLFHHLSMGLWFDMPFARCPSFLFKESMAVCSTFFFGVPRLTENAPSFALSPPPDFMLARPPGPE